jgi:hypothetical protein
MILRNSQKLEELTNAIALLREQQQKVETTSLDQMELELELPPCLRLLPLETWTDIFGFLPRPQLPELVPQIGDWHFAGKAQYYLHECGRITLGNLDIRRSTSWINRKNGLPVVKFYEDHYKYNAINNKSDWEYPLADVPIPNNIIDFEGIHIRLAFFLFKQNSYNLPSFFRYFNEIVLGFLQEFQRNSLLTNVHLCLYKTNLESNALSQLVSLLTSIEKLILFYIDIEAFIQQGYSKTLLESARILYIESVFSHKIFDLIC